MFVLFLIIINFKVLLGYHTYNHFTYIKMVRGDNLNTKIVHQEKRKINIILNERHPDILNDTKQVKSVDISELKLIDEHFSAFIGLEHMKYIVKEIYASMLINKKRQAMGLTNKKQALHMLFKGNPGTGKTTVARELAKLFATLNILSKGHFIEAERADLVGEYIGQTAQKTRAMIQKSLGGILFIDEAYSLVRGGQKDFGREAIDTLVKQMEDYHEDFMLILAGYPAEMDQFKLANPGLQSRFPFHMDFENYTIPQLIDIAKQMASEREYELTNEAVYKLKQHLTTLQYSSTVHFSNARYIRNIIEKSIRMQAVRLLKRQQHTYDDLICLTTDDFQFDG